MTALRQEAAFVQEGDPILSNVAPAAPALGRIRRDALIYGFGTVMRHAATLIMLPIYTRLLTPRDYGLLQMLDMTLDVASILMSAGMTAGVMRFYFKATTQQQSREVVVSAAFLVLSLNLVGAILIAAGAGPIHAHVLGGAGARYLIYIAAANFVLGQTLTVPMLLMQIQGRATLFSATSLVRLVCQLSLNILLLVVLRLGPLGILVSSLITNVLVGGAALIWMLRKVGIRPSRAAFHDLRRFGVPIQIATAATFVLQFGDRFFLGASRGLTAVGLYAFAYQFGFLLDQLGTAAFMRAWQPRRFANAHLPRDVRERADNTAFHALTLVVVSFGLGMALFVRPALRLVASPEYFDSAKLVPIIVAAFVFQAWGGVVEFGIEAAEKTRYITFVVWTSAALILLLYAVLIPPFGAYGAGAATMISFAVRTVLLGYFSNRVWPQRYDWSPPLRIFAIAVVVCALAWLFPADGLVAEIRLLSALYALYLLAVWRLALSRDVRGLVTTMVRARASRLAFLTRRLATPPGVSR